MPASAARKTDSNRAGGEPSSVAALGAPALPHSPERYYARGELRQCFAKGAAGSMACARWIARLPAGYTRPAAGAKRGGAAIVFAARGDAVLPGGALLWERLTEIDGGGVRIGEELADRQDPRLIAMAADEARIWGTFEAVWRERPKQRWAAETIAEVERRTCETWARLKFPRTKSALIARRNRYLSGQAPDMRTLRSGRHRCEIDSRLVAVAESLYLDDRRFSMAIAHEFVAREARRLGLKVPSVHAVRRLLRRIPPAAAALARQGEETFKRLHIPRARMDYSALQPGDYLCSDGSDSDTRVAIPDPLTGELRAERVVWVGALCLRTARMIAVVARTENSLAVARLIRRVLVAWGVPSDWARDNGRGLETMGGERLRAVADRGGCLDRLGVRVHAVTARTPQAKRIESLWRLARKEGCDRWHADFLGGSPAERAERCAKLDGAAVADLPTLAEYERHVELAAEAWNARPRAWLGGLSPNQAFERWRTTPWLRMDPQQAKIAATCYLEQRRVGRDGVRFSNLRYRIEDIHDALRLRNQTVWVGEDLDGAGRIVLADEKFRPIAAAVEWRLNQYGVDAEAARDNARRQAAFRRETRRYLENRNKALLPPTEQILRARAMEARHAEAAAAAKLPPAADPGTGILLNENAKAAADLARRLRRRAIQQATQSEQPREPAMLGMDEVVIEPREQIMLSAGEPGPSEEEPRWDEGLPGFDDPAPGSVLERRQWWENSGETSRESRDAG